MTSEDQYYMNIALEEARRAFEEDEIPVGAVVVVDGRVVGRGRNAKEGARDPTAHAEMVAIRRAARKLGRWRLTGCTLYVSLEPCPMCVGAMLSARVDRLVFGCTDPKAGAVVSVCRLADNACLNHRMEVTSGVLADDATGLLKSFFTRLRNEQV